MTNEFRINEARASAAADALELAAQMLKLEVEWHRLHTRPHRYNDHLEQALSNVRMAQNVLKYLRKQASTAAPDSNPTEHIG